MKRKVERLMTIVLLFVAMGVFADTVFLANANAWRLVDSHHIVVYDHGNRPLCMIEVPQANITATSRIEFVRDWPILRIQDGGWINIDGFPQHVSRVKRMQ